MLSSLVKKETILKDGSIAYTTQLIKRTAPPTIAIILFIPIAWGLVEANYRKEVLTHQSHLP